jgi:hypothetical protein
MQRLYRTMAKDVDGRPRVGRSATALGVRVAGPHADVHPDVDGLVHPGGGGMSVTIDDVRMMPTVRRPAWIVVDGAEGASKHPLFALPVVAGPLALRVRRESDDETEQARFAHGFVEPANSTPLEHYEAAVTGTRPNWMEVPHGPRA